MSNSNTNLQTQSSNALHNAIMEAGSKDRPPMLAPGNYVQWKSRIKRYIDTKPNSELIHHSLQNPPLPTYQWAQKTFQLLKMMNELVRNQCHVTNHQVNVQFLLQLQPEWQRGTGYDNHKAVNVVGAGENVGTPIVQKSGIQCYNCKEYGHVSRECQKPKRVNVRIT
ncbi:retrovirus-related pol polyprotein from transposon TNT 1-94 [Tanacetum coccineum]